MQRRTTGDDSFIQLTLDDDDEAFFSTNLHNLVDKGRQVGTFKSLLQASHLIENTAKSPDIRPVIVRLAFTLPAKYTDHVTSLHNNANA